MDTTSINDTVTWLAGYFLQFMIFVGSFVALSVHIGQRTGSTALRFFFLGASAIVITWRVGVFIQHPGIQAEDAMLVLALLFALSGARGGPRREWPRLVNRWRRRADEIYAVEPSDRIRPGE